MANINNRLDRVVQALKDRPARDVDFSEEFNRAVNLVFGDSPGVERLVLGLDFLKTLELIYGEEVSNHEQQS